MRALGESRVEVDDTSKGKAKTEELRSEVKEANRNDRDFMLHRGDLNRNREVNQSYK